jgi:hypothetical protein
MSLLQEIISENLVELKLISVGHPSLDLFSHRPVQSAIPFLRYPSNDNTSGNFFTFLSSKILFS